MTFAEQIYNISQTCIRKKISKHKYMRVYFHRKKRSSNADKSKVTSSVDARSATGTKRNSPAIIYIALEKAEQLQRSIILVNVLNHNPAREFFEIRI